MSQIISVQDIVSPTFEIPVGEQITLYATGLAEGDYVRVELVELSEPSVNTDQCCSGPVVLPEVTAAVELKCRNGNPMRLTAGHPYLVLDAPQGVKMQARVESENSGFIAVQKIDGTNSSGCSACACA